MADLSNLVAELSRNQGSQTPFFTQKDPLKIATYPEALKYVVHELCRKPAFLVEVKRLMAEQQRRLAQLEQEKNDIAQKLELQKRDQAKVSSILLSVGISGGAPVCADSSMTLEEAEEAFYSQAHTTLTNMYDYIYTRFEELKVPLFCIGPEAKAKGGKGVRQGQMKLVEFLETLVE